MIPISPNPFAGVTLHGAGALLAANCYAPQKFIRRWSWETFWLVQAAFCWLIWPFVGAALTIPELGAVLSEAVDTCPGYMLLSFLFGLAYGIGGMAFNHSIKYIGFSLTYAIAIGLSAILGTTVPPLVRGEIRDILTRTGSSWIIAGLLIGMLGIAFCGVAGRLKEISLDKRQSGKGEFSMVKGLVLSVVAGVLSAVYGFALEAAEPVAKIAAAHGAGHWEGNVKYITANTGAFVTSFIYCMILARKNRSFGEFVRLPKGDEPAGLLRNYTLAIFVGTLWYGQFFFYNLGHVRMGDFKFISWGIHMIMLVLFSALTGVLFREWKGCNKKTIGFIVLSLISLVASVVLLTYGNYVGSQAAQ